MFHGPIISTRFFRRGLVRQTVFDTDLAFPFGPYCRDQILAGSSGRSKPVRVHTVGSPRFDKYFHPGRTKGEYLRTLGLSDSRPVVVYAPHWSELNLPGDAGVDLFRGAVGELAKLTVQIIVKLHAMSMVPGAAGGRNWDDLLRAAESSRVRVDRGMEDVDALLAADVLVTDVSSRAFNFMLLDKPVVLYPRAHPPAGSLAQTTYDMLCRGAVVAESLHELGERVQEALANPLSLSDQRRRIAEALFANPGHATDSATQILYSELGLLP
jgi:CDP-glycerol glycerophosphotransferase (TagB/SpsB family)